MILKSAAGTKPTELDLGQPPRMVQTRKRAHVLRWFLILLTVAVAVFFISYGRSERSRLDSLYSQGRQVAGTIAEKTYSRSSHTLHYKYVVDAREYTGLTRVNSEQYDATAIGSPATITYLPANPRVKAFGEVRADDGTAAERRNTTLGLVFGAFVFVGVVVMERSIRRDRRLCEAGVAVNGTVTDQTRGKYAKTHYKYTSGDGATRQGSAQATFGTSDLAIGASLVVLYDPSDPAISKPHKGISLARIVK